MNTSPFQIVLYVIFGLGALIGLFVFATYSSKTDTSGIGTVVIWGTLPSAGVQATLTAISSVDPTFKGASYVEKNALSLPSDLATAIATNAGPDLILTSHEQLQSLSKFLNPIPYDTLSASAFSTSFIAGADIFTAPAGSGYYGIPFLVDPLLLFSNRAILASSGVGRPPAQWEAFVGLVPSVAVVTPSREISRGLVALGTYDNVKNARAILSSLFLQQGVLISGYSATGALAADLGSSAGGSAVLSFYAQFADPAKVSYTWNASQGNSRAEFLSGDLALYFGYLSEAPELRKANPNLNFEVSALPQPGTATLKSGYGLIYGFLFPRGSANIAGAYQVASRLASAEQAVAAQATGLAPVSYASLSATPSDPVATVGYASALYTRGWLSPSAGDTDALFSGMIGSVISGRLSISSALSSAERALTALLQK